MSINIPNYKNQLNMSNKKLFSYISLTFIIIYSSHAEIVLDNTLHPNSLKLTGPNYQINAQLGQQQGNNLFHSFAHFNLKKGESATFLGPQNINNIINRVTGGQPSHINGLIRSTIPKADFYLINPFGIFFKEQATLDVQGSFHASTADVLHLQDNGKFDARQPDKSILTTAPISAFGFLTNMPADLKIQGSNLSLPTGETLSLIGGKLYIENQTPPVYHAEEDSFLVNNESFKYSSQLSVGKGRFNLVGVASKGKVILKPTGLNISTQPNNITLKNAKLNANGKGGGAVYIHADQLLLDNSRIEAKTLGKENGKEINIRANNIRLIHGGRLDGSIYGAGNGTDIKIHANNLIVVTGDNGYPFLFDGTQEGNSVIFTTIRGKGQLSSKRKGGKIELTAKQLQVTEGALIYSLALAPGQSGDIKIQVSDSVEISGDGDGGFISTIASGSLEMEAQNEANAGSLELTAGQLLIDEGGELFTSTGSLGDGGDLKVRVTGTMTVSGAGRFGFASFVGSTSIPNTEHDVGVAGKVAGKGGNTWIEAGEIILKDGGFIDASANAPGDTQSQGSGNIFIQTSGAIKISGVNPYGENRDGLSSGIYARSRGIYAGTAGSIFIKAGSLTILEGGTISSGTSSSAPGGIVNIMVNGTLTISGTSANITLREPAISQQVAQQTFPNQRENISRSSIHASSSGIADNSGQAGDIIISANTINLEQNGTINTSTNNAGGGHITIITPNQLYLQRGEITTSVQGGKGNGGNITIKKPTFIIANEGYIKAQAKIGRGGNIHINSKNYFKSNNSIVSASSKLGINGKITVNSPDETLSNSLIILPGVLIDASTLLKSCGIYSDEIQDKKSSFIIEHMVRKQKPSDWKSSAITSK